MLHHIDFTRDGAHICYNSKGSSKELATWFETAKGWPSAKLVLIPINDGRTVGKLSLIAPDDTYYAPLNRTGTWITLIEGPPAEIRDAVDAHIRMQQ